MPADAANRSDARDALYTLFNTALVGTGKPVQAVYGYKVGKIEESPVVVIASSASKRSASGMNDTRWRNEFIFEVFTFVRDAVEDNNAWTEADVEDTLDLIDKEIADVIADNRNSPSNWSYLDLSDEPSEIVTDTERGYIIEMRKVIVTYIEG